MADLIVVYWRDIPAQVTVKKGNDRVRMTAEYMVVLDFPGYKYEWNIKHELDRPIFIV